MKTKNSHETPGMGNSPSRYRTWMMLLITVVAAAGLVYWSQRSPSDELKVPDTGQLSNAEKESLLDRKEEMTTKELIALAVDLKLPDDASLPEQIKWIEDRMDISSELLAKSGDELAQKEGTLRRLEALQRLSYLNRKYRLGNKTVDAELNELSEANLTHDNPEISKIAGVALMLTAIQKFVNQPDDSSRKEALQVARETAARLKDDEELAAGIFSYARYMKQSDHLVNGSIEFFNVVMDVYADSENVNASRLAKESYNEIVFGDQTATDRLAKLMITAINDRFRQQIPDVEQEISSRVRYALRDEFVDQQAIDQIFRMLEILLSNQKIETATDLKNEVEAYLSQSIDRQLTSTSLAWLQGLDTRLKWHSQPLDLSEFRNVVDGEPFERENRDGILVFWNPVDQPSVRLLSNLAAQTPLREMQIVAVCEEQNADDRELLEKFAAEMTNLTFVTYSGNNERFPIPESPYLLMIDKDNNLIVVNPRFIDLGRYVGRLAK